jgi:TolB-like protein
MFNVNARLIIATCFLLLLTNLPAQSGQNEILHVAVFNFEGKGISTAEAELLTDRFRGELVNTDSFIVIERSIMNQILDEHNLQMSGFTETSDAVQAGRILNVQKVITGSVGKIGATFSTNIKLIDVESAQIQRFFNRDHRGEIDGLLLILKEIANEVAGKSEPESHQENNPETQEQPNIDPLNF